jgi:hypothetical protein
MEHQDIKKKNTRENPIHRARADYKENPIHRARADYKSHTKGESRLQRKNSYKILDTKLQQTRFSKEDAYTKIYSW